MLADGLLIRRATAADRNAIWAIIGPTIRAGETYALDRDMSEQAALGYWLAPDRTAFVAEDQGGIVGTYFLRANNAGGGRHVCNCAYITDGAETGRGIARRMLEHSLSEARSAGFRAMQFNFVISSNERACGSGSPPASTSSDACRAPSSIRPVVRWTPW